MNTREITLNSGEKALVDEADYEDLIKWKWYFSAGAKGERYALRSAGRGMVYMHRQLLGLERGDGRLGDHINRNRLDNRRANLRIVTPSQNSQNHPGHRAGTSRYRGVSWHKGAQKWAINMKFQGRQYYFGLYEDEEEAAEVAREHRRRLMPASVD